jgi:hypothetical protein
LDRLRVLVPVANAIVGIDLADKKQMVVVTDHDSKVLIARLTAQLRCYVPEPVDETWGRLRHLGTRREQLLVEAGSQVRQMRPLLGLVLPLSSSGEGRAEARSGNQGSTAVLAGVLAANLAKVASSRFERPSDC